MTALRERGLSGSDITHVVCSHGHSDHVGNLNLFPDALLVVSYDICRGDTYFENGLAKVWQHQMYAVGIARSVFYCSLLLPLLLHLQD